MKIEHELRIGFTGTRNGMTKQQKEVIEDLLLKCQAVSSEQGVAIDGVCVGSDTDFNKLAKEALYHTKGYPGHSMKNPTDLTFRGDGEYDELEESDTHFARNRRIVNDTNVLFATPYSNNLDGPGGTNFTISYARKRNKPVYVVYPDGETEFFGTLD